jgi:uncharacterized protein (TIGR02246 family)
VEDAEIVQARATFVGALNDGDAHAAAAVYAPDARLLAPSAELLKGRGAIEAFWATGVAAGISNIELDVVELERRDGFAYEIGRYAIRLRPAEGGTVVEHGKYLLLHTRQADGSWRRAVEMFNPDAPPERSQER